MCIYMYVCDDTLWTFEAFSYFNTISHRIITHVFIIQQM